MKRSILLASLMALGACVEPQSSTEPAPQAQTPQATSNAAGRLSSSQALSNFNAVVRSVEPLAERECRARAPDLNCDFKIVVDKNPRKPPNAFQTLEASGRPVIGFTIALIADARNRDELAFVMGHEAAHHISRHLEKQRQSAIGGSLLGSLGAAVLGVDPSLGADIGGFVGSRAYSKQNELEADTLGTVIARRAGYNPVRGVAFFTRIPDPGNKFLGTHPPNADRINTVKRVNSKL
jgi:predicted Zn-dependent protease